ncbi:GTP binding protein [Botrytis cinerea]
MEDRVDTSPQSSNRTRSVDPMDTVNGDSNTRARPAPFKDGNGEKRHLTEEEQKDMSSSIADIFKLEEQSVSAEDVDMDDDAEEVVDVEDRERRTERLKGALGKLVHLWWQDSIAINEAAEKLADGSRDPKWRVPLGDSGILNFFLELLSAHTLRHALKLQILRLVGNSCADTDENRARVVASNCIPLIITQLSDTNLLAFAIPVLYNVCVDYVPAQQQASGAYLSKELIALIASPRFKDSVHFLGYVCKLLDLLVQQPSEPDTAPDDTPIVLLKLASDRENPVDMDDYIALVNTAVAYLGHEKFQKTLVKTPQALDTALAVLVNSYTRFDSHPSIGPSTPHEDDAKLLSQMRINLNSALSDISALPEFKEACPVISPFSSSLRRWLSSEQIQLQVCACIMLGNLARNNEACELFVHTARVHLPLVPILRDVNDSQLLHAALGFLKNLALPMKNKEVLGSSGIFEVLPRLWLLDILQPIQLSSISLARQLVNGSMENVERLCARLSTDKDSPAHERSNISLLIALFDRTDVEPIRMEISRLITAVCRVFTAYKGRPAEELNETRRKFLLRHPDIGRPLSFMVSQNKWPIVRSEGWFVFALMARYPDSAQCISDMMQDVTVFQPLVEMLTGKPLLEYKPTTTTNTSPSNPQSESSGTLSLEPQTPDPEPVQPHAQAAEMARLDRENALVLVSELLKNRGKEMAVMRRTLFEDLLKGGGELVMSYRQAKEENGPGKWIVSDHGGAGLNLQEVATESMREIS